MPAPRCRSQVVEQLPVDLELSPELRKVVKPRGLLRRQEPHPLVLQLLLAEVWLPVLLVPEHLLLLLLVRNGRLLLPDQLHHDRTARRCEGGGPGDRGHPVRLPGPAEVRNGSPNRPSALRSRGRSLSFACRPSGIKPPTLPDHRRRYDPSAWHNAIARAVRHNLHHIRQLSPIQFFLFYLPACPGSVIARRIASRS